MCVCNMCVLPAKFALSRTHITHYSFHIKPFYFLTWLSEEQTETEDYTKRAESLVTYGIYELCHVTTIFAPHANPTLWESTYITS